MLIVEITFFFAGTRELSVLFYFTFSPRMFLGEALMLEAARNTTATVSEREMDDLVEGVIRKKTRF